MEGNHKEARIRMKNNNNLAGPSMSLEYSHVPHIPSPSIRFMVNGSLVYTGQRATWAGHGPGLHATTGTHKHTHFMGTNFESPGRQHRGHGLICNSKLCALQIDFALFLFVILLAYVFISVSQWKPILP